MTIENEPLRRVHTKTCHSLYTRTHLFIHHQLGTMSPCRRKMKGVQMGWLSKTSWRSILSIVIGLEICSSPPLLRTSSSHSNSRNLFFLLRSASLPLTSKESRSGRLGKEKDDTDHRCSRIVPRQIREQSEKSGRKFFLCWWRAVIFVTLQGSMVLIGSLSVYPLFGSERENDTHKEAGR